MFSRIYRLSAYPCANNQIFQVRSTDGPICTASIKTTGQLALHDSGVLNTNAAITTTAVPVGKEFRVVFTVDGPMFTAAVYPDLTSVAPQTIAGTIKAAAITHTREGNPNAGGMSAASLDLAWPVDDTTSDPGVRKYVYLTLDARNGIVPKQVNAHVHDENLPAGTKTYSVWWGDGTTSGPQSSPLFSHTFITPGDWAITPVVDVI